VGIFIGLQVDDWDKEKTFFKKETQLLKELKIELEDSILFMDGISSSYKQATEAGRRSLNFISSGSSCDTNCWSVLIDFMTASQWQSTQVRTSTYENMRTLGMPVNRAIINAVEAYLLTTRTNVTYYARVPLYRSEIRQLLPLEIQERYWERCYSSKNGLEYYDLDCTEGTLDKELLVQAVSNILSNSKIKPYLTFWTSTIVSTPQDLEDQNIEARKAISLIDAELKNRQ